MKVILRIAKLPSNNIDALECLASPGLESHRWGKQTHSFPLGIQEHLQKWKEKIEREK